MAGGGGYAEESRKALAKHADQVYGDYASVPAKAWVVGAEFGDSTEKVNMKELLDKIESEIVEYSAGKG